MKQNEPVEALRTLSATIYDVDGDLVPAAFTWLAGMVRISKAGGAFANTANLPNSVSGGGDGDFDLVLTTTEVDTIGNIRVRFYDDAVGTNLLAEYVDQVVASTVQTSGSSSTSWSFSGNSIFKADVLALAAELSALPDAAWVMVLAFVNSFRGLDCDLPLKKLALSFLAAHFATVAGFAGSSGATGPVISETVANLKRTYAAGITTASQADLNRTGYGQQFLALMKFSPRTRGPFLV